MMISTQFFLHPSLRILCLVMLAIIVQCAHLYGLFILANMLLLFLFIFKANNVIKLLAKVKWLVLMILLIYALNTPGEYIKGWSFAIAPTYEGLHIGFIQVLKLCMMVAGVALLMKTTNALQLIAGFYQLFQPLQFIGLSAERFAVRLWLTMDYVNTHRVTFKLSDFSKLFSIITAPSQFQADTRTSISIELSTFGFKELICLLILLLLTRVLCVLH